MIIYLLVARTPGESPWIVDAWDEWTAEENGHLGEEALRKARKQCGKDAEIREAVVEVSDEFLDRVFLPYSEAALEEKP